MDTVASNGCPETGGGRFVFVISENGKQRPVEYFTNQIDAEIFQADYNKTHNYHSLPGHQITLEELYHRWLPAHTADTVPSRSTLCSYENSFKHLSFLHQEPFASLKYMDYQRIMDDMRKAGCRTARLKSAITYFITLSVRQQNRAYQQELCSPLIYRKEQAGQATQAV